MNQIEYNHHLISSKTLNRDIPQEVIKQKQINKIKHINYLELSFETFLKSGFVTTRTFSGLDFNE